MVTKFRALACPVDASTGDQRRFAEGALDAAPCPMPARHAREDVGGHDGAVTIAAIDSVDMGTPGEIWLEGHLLEVDRETMPRLAEDVAEATALMQEGVVGFSVDLDDFEATIVKAGTDEEVGMDDFEDPDMKMEMLITKGRIRSATLVGIPAFVETNHTITLTTEDAPAEADAVVASLSGSTDLPVVADREHEWDGGAAAGRVFDANSNEDGTVDKAGAGRAFLWVDGDGTQRGDYKLGFADVVDGELRIVPRGVAATAGGRGVDATDLSPADKDAVKGRICTLYSQVRDTFEDWPECPFDSGDAAHETETGDAALIASLAMTDLIPFSVFTPPVTITGPTPITYDFAATPPVAYGHIATWKTCHEGFKDSCVLAPRDPGAGYRDFHTHVVETDQGPVYAGRITAGGRHPERTGLGAHAARRHHDAMTEVARVVATEDEWGLFVCGPITSGLDDATLRIMSRRKVSGHWEETADGLALVEVLALKDGPRQHSEPGFPILASYSGGRQVALCAALGPEADTPKVPGYAEIFRQAYSVIREEDAKREQAETERLSLASILAEEAAMMAEELLRTVEG